MSEKTGLSCRIINIAAKMILLCTLLLSAVILYQNIEVIFEFKSFNVFIYLAVLISIAGFMLYLAKFNIPEKIYITLIIILSFISRLCFIVFVQTPVNGDFLLIFNAAKDVIEGDMSWLQKPFFSVWGYQIPFVYYEAFILKLFGSVFALKLLNVIFMVATNVLIYLIAREFTSPGTAFISAVLYSVYPAPIMLSSVLTNQHISLMFFMLSIYFYLVNPSWRRVLLSGVFLLLGNLTRPEAILIIAAMSVHTVVCVAGNLKWEYIKDALSKTLSIFIAFAILTGLSSVLFKATGAAPDGISNNCPEWKFVLGLDTASNGTYNDRNGYIISIEDRELRQREAKKAISISLSECKNIPLFLYNKTKIMWANMESASWPFFHIQRNRPVWKEFSALTFGEAIWNITHFDKSIYMLLHVLLIIACVILWSTPVSHNHRAFFFITLILINYAVYVFIEIQTRYRYFIMPSFFILTALVWFRARGQAPCPRKPIPIDEVQGEDNKTGILPVSAEKTEEGRTDNGTDTMSG